MTDYAPFQFREVMAGRGWVAIAREGILLRLSAGLPTKKKH